MKHYHPVILLFTGILTVTAQEESTARMTNPFNSDEDRAAGAKIYQSQCASCHGLDGKGGQGTPDFTSGQFRRASSDEGLFQIVAKGIPGTTMPAFSFEGKQIWQLLAHIRSFRFSRSVTNLNGDIAKGRELFRTKGCIRCHGSSAPDLSRLSRNRSAAEVRRSIEDPDAEVDSAWWRLHLVLRDGQSFRGRRLNEDTHTVQFLDEQGRLRGVSKSDIASYEINRKSLMPSFRDKLQLSELNNLVAYLLSGDIQ